MYTREVLLPKIATALLVVTTLLAAWPKAHAADRAPVTEAAEAKSPKKTKRKRTGQTQPGAHAAARSMSRRFGTWSHQLRVTAQADVQRKLIDIVLATARAQLGKPYHWAGSGPATFDCSGLTRFAYAAAGVSLPHNSAAQSASVKSVPIGELRAGDLVFSGPGRIRHVGIYIGGGRMIHAPHSGRSVEVAPLRSNLIGAGRPV